ncbi:MAG: hypothetical protein U0V73_08545 [Acidimicrobiia bacterium]
MTVPIHTTRELSGPPDARILGRGTAAILLPFTQSWGAARVALPDPIPWGQAPSVDRATLTRGEFELSTAADVRSLRYRVFEMVDEHGTPGGAPAFEASCGAGEPVRCDRRVRGSSQVITMRARGTLPDRGFVTVSARWVVWARSDGTLRGDRPKRDEQAEVRDVDQAWLLRLGDPPMP